MSDVFKIDPEFFQAASQGIRVKACGFCSSMFPENTAETCRKQPEKVVLLLVLKNGKRPPSADTVGRHAPESGL